jgi:hypothetical protein
MQTEVLLYDFYDTEKENPIMGMLHKENNLLVITMENGDTKTLDYLEATGWQFDFVDKDMPCCINDCENCITPIC